LGANDRLGVRLVARGFGWGWRPHWMALTRLAIQQGCRHAVLNAIDEGERVYRRAGFHWPAPMLACLRWQVQR
jgi:hypothetical protein